MQPWQDKYREKLITAQEAAKLVKSGDRVIFSHHTRPLTIVNALIERKDELEGVTVGSTWGADDLAFLRPGMEKSFTIISGMTPRVPVIESKHGDWLIWVPSLGVDHRQRERGGYVLYADVFSASCTPPDAEGYCSFGHQVWWSPQATKTAKIAVCEIHPNLIRTYGDQVHVDEIDYLVEPPTRSKEELLAQRPMSPTSSREEYDAAQVIGANVADLIRDGDTFEVGAGNASEPVYDFLGTKNDLGVHTELVYAPTIELIKKGVISGKRKNINKGKVITTGSSFRRGDPRLAGVDEFINENPMFEFYDVSYVCNIPRIAANRNMVAINTIVRMDLLGQVQISHVGARPISSVGGQTDFTIGAHYSEGGRAISCLLSTALGGKVSRIVPQLEQGSVIAIPMYYIDYLATEYGVVNLEYKTTKQKAEAIISVAHPDFQPELRQAARKLFYP